MQRILASLLTSLIALAGAAHGAAPGWTDHVVLNELQPNPVGTDRGNEWIELYNPGVLDQSLEGWSLLDDRGRTHDLAGLAVPALGYLVVTLDQSLQLVNSGGDVSLLDADGAVVDRVRYGGVEPGDPSPRDAPGEGESLARYFVHGEHGLTAQGKNYEWYVDDEPTPGDQNRFVLPAPLDPA